MKKKDLDGVYKLGEGEKAIAAYVRLGNVMEVSDPALRRFVGQPLKTLVRFLENREAEEFRQILEPEDECCSVGGLAVELGLYEKGQE